MAIKTTKIPDHLDRMIKKVCKEFDMDELKDIDIAFPLRPGENLLGQIMSINIDRKDRKNQSAELKLIAKMAPTQQLYRQFFPIRSFYKREMHLYSTVIPELTKIQRENSVKHIFAPFAKCLETYCGESEETLLLQNMRELGYQTIDYGRPLDYEHASLVLKTIGKLHALSFALQNQKPDLFKRLRVNEEEYMFNHNFVAVVKKIGAQALSHFKEGTNAYRAFKKLIQDPSYVINTLYLLDLGEKYGVINHGDAQIKNFMFKYNNELDSGNPTDMCLLDWQLSRYGSPILDLSLLLWTGTDKIFRDRYHMEMLDIYYNSLSSFLRELGGDANKSYPRHVFEEHLKKFSVIGLCIATIGISISMTDLEAIPNIYIGEDTESVINMFATVTNHEYFTRIEEAVSDFLEYGYDI